MSFWQAVIRLYEASVEYPIDTKFVELSSFIWKNFNRKSHAETHIETLTYEVMA